MAMENILRHLKPNGGNLFILLKESETNRTENQRYFRYWKEEEFKQFLSNYPLKLLKIIQQKQERVNWLAFLLRSEMRPDCIKHWAEIQEPDNAHYKDSSELLSIGSPFGKIFNLNKLGIHHEVLPPGRRTSYPHAESDEEEFVYVLEGEPDVWIDGYVYRLKEGEAVGFPSGTGLCHTVINDTDRPVRLLVVGEKSKASNKIYYPLNPEQESKRGETWWKNVPKHTLGPHHGKPSAR
jgi:uncharacterized cupin superfamily protein